MVTAPELERMAKRWSEPTGVDFLDGIYDRIKEKEEPTKYYRFLYRLAESMQPKVIVELGVYNGWATAHLSKGAPQAKVLAVDPAPVLTEFEKVLSECPNIHWLQYRSEKVGKLINYEIDLLFMDSEHKAAQAKLEYSLFRPKMRSGGIIVCDDIWYWDMNDFWSAIYEPKLELIDLHPGPGFGVILVN